MRSCGPCAECCTVSSIRELDKPAYVGCSKLGDVEGGSCTEYGARPASCSGYRCAWLQGEFKESDRPDLVGLLVDRASVAGRPDILSARVTMEGSSKSPAAVEFTQRLAKEGELIILRQKDGGQTMLGLPDNVRAFRAHCEGAKRAASSQV